MHIIIPRYGHFGYNLTNLFNSLLTAKITYSSLNFISSKKAFKNTLKILKKNYAFHRCYLLWLEPYVIMIERLDCVLREKVTSQKL